MTTYEVIDPLTGSRWRGDLKYLSRNLKVNALLRSVSEDGARTNLGLILQRDVVFFALQWAKSIDVEPTAEALKCFELIEKWLEDEDSVTKEELVVVAADANRVAYDAYAAVGKNASDAAYAAGSAAAAASHGADGAGAGGAVGASLILDAVGAAICAASFVAGTALDAGFTVCAADSLAYTSQGQMIVDYYASSCANQSTV